MLFLDSLIQILPNVPVRLSEYLTPRASSVMAATGPCGVVAHGRLLLIIYTFFL